MNFYNNENEIVPLTNEYEMKIEDCKRLFALTKKQTVEQLNLTSETFKTIENELNIKFKSVLKQGRYGVNTNEGKLISIQRKMRDALDKYQRKIKYLISDLNKPEPVFEVVNETLSYARDYSKWYDESFKIMVHNYSYQTKKTKGIEVKVGDFIVQYGERYYISKEILKVVKITKSCIFYDMVRGDKVAEDDGFRKMSFEHTLFMNQLGNVEGVMKKMSNKGYFSVIQGNPAYILTEQVRDYGN